MFAILAHLKHWAPFHIDALGIVTILGADQMDLVLGRLAKAGFSGLLPLLGAYKIADNSIVKPISGFTLYNVSDGILATDVTGWFTRWLLCQDLTFTSSTLSISVNNDTVSKSWLCGLQQSITGSIAMFTLLLVAVLTDDWWGLANWAAMAISVVVRRAIIGQNLAALDLATSKSNIRANESVKVLLSLPTGNIVTIKVPRGVVLHCLLTTPVPPNPQWYNSMRMLGWTGFGIHMVALGMSALINQILAVTVLLVSTIVVARRIGDDDSCIASCLHIQREDFIGPDFRAAAMARMDLSKTEEENMLAWSLFPQKSNKDWWEKYRVCQASVDRGAFRHWDQVLATPFAMTAPSTTAPQDSSPQ